jgi:hypothetical protein
MRALGLRGESILNSGGLLDSLSIPASASSNTIDGVYTFVGSDTDGQTEHSNRDVVEDGHGRVPTSPYTPLDTPPSVNLSELRLGPMDRAPLPELALFSRYSADEPRAAPAEDEAAWTSRLVTASEYTIEDHGYTNYAGHDIGPANGANSLPYLTDFMRGSLDEERERWAAALN